MTSRDWAKADRYTPDPGAVVEVRDTGGVFCGNDARPFLTKKDRSLIAADKAKRKRNNAKWKLAKKKLKAERVEHVGGLRVPLKRAQLIMAVMRELGDPLPTKLRALNFALMNLINDGVISADGTFNTKHPLILNWFAIVRK